MQTLVTGITGYVGGRIAPRLLADGHEVRGLARHPERAAPPRAVPIVKGDLSTGAGLDEALDGVDVAYYLVHSMEGTKNFADDEHRGAANFAAAAGRAGVERIVYMSVLTPQHPPYSPHVDSRIAVEAELSSHGAEVISLRASIAIGAESRSFRFLLHLVERFPVLLLPPWRNNRTAPIDERDLIDALSAAATAAVHQRLSIHDAVGPEIVTYEALCNAISQELMISRPVVPFPLQLTAVTAPIAAAVAGEDLGLVHPLMSSLGSDLLAHQPPRTDVDLGTAVHGVDAAIRHALRTTHANDEKDA